MSTANKIQKLLEFIFCFVFLSNSVIYSADIQFTGATTSPLTSPNVYYVPNGSTVTMINTAFTINNGATLEVRAGGTLNLGNTFNTLTTAGGSMIKVLPGGTLNTQSRLIFLGGTLRTYGTLNATSYNGRIVGTGPNELYSPGVINISSSGSPGAEINTSFGNFYNYGGTLNLLGTGHFSNSINTYPGNFYQTSGTININSTEGFRNGDTGSQGVLNISGGLINIINGSLKNGYAHSGSLPGILNLSGGEIRVSNGTIENGRGAIAGIMNVSGTGKILVTGGGITNNNASSAINVNRNGSVTNYYGTINTTLGSFTVNSGGRFYNVRGNYPAHITFNTGSACEDSDEVYLNDDIYLDSTWTITNKAVINGQGHVLTFSSNNGIIRIAKRASLLLRDIVIQNVSGNQIRCMDTFSTLSLDKCTWLLDADYSFTKGRMYIAGDWNIVGNNHSFSYQSRKESSLAEDANLNIVDTTFIYDINISNTLFNPLSSTANICLQNSTLQASQNWKPASGTLLFNGNVTLNGVATLDLQDISNIKNHGSISRIGTILM